MSLRAERWRFMKTANSSPDSIGPKRSHCRLDVSTTSSPSSPPGPPDPQTLSTQLSPFCFGILLQLMIYIPVYSDSNRCVLRPWPSMDTSETFAHIYSQNIGVHSAPIRLFIADGQNMLVCDAFCCCFGSIHQREAPGREKLGKFTFLVS